MNRSYQKPEIILEQFSTKGYVTACGDLKSDIPEQTLHCIADTTETAFTATSTYSYVKESTINGCSNIVSTSSIVTTTQDYYYNSPNSAATDIYDGSVDSGASSGSYCLTAGSYFVWLADVGNIKNAKHAQKFSTITGVVAAS